MISKMTISEEAKIISRKTKTEIGLLYLLPKEIQKTINNNRIIIFRESNGEIFAFCLWNIYSNSWHEITALYVDPLFRKRGYFNLIIKELRRRLQPLVKNAFIFTRHPAVVRVVKSAGFVKSSVFKLPWKIILKLIIRLFNIRRIPTYLKLLPIIFKMRMRIFVFQKPAD